MTETGTTSQHAVKPASTSDARSGETGAESEQTGNGCTHELWSSRTLIRDGVFIAKRWFCDECGMPGDFLWGEADYKNWVENDGLAVQSENI